VNETGAKEKLIPFLFNGAGNHFLYKNIIHIGCYSICYNTLFTKFEMLQSYRHFSFKCQSSPFTLLSSPWRLLLSTSTFNCRTNRPMEPHPVQPTQPPYRITYELLLAGIRAIVPATLCSLGVGIS